MKCLLCGCLDSKVIDSRVTEDGMRIRRRRECTNCQNRFTTYEMIETTPLMVIKKDESRQMFDRTKLMGSIIRACGKRPVSVERMENITSNIEKYCIQNGLKEISSSRIGEMVLDQLKNSDPVAYIRFASVYRDFTDIESFVNELESFK